MTDQPDRDAAPSAQPEGEAESPPQHEGEGQPAAEAPASAQAHPWADPDRPRGLDAWFAPGGEDDAPPDRIADERRLVRLLAVMIALLVGLPLLLTAIAFVIDLTSQRGG